MPHENYWWAEDDQEEGIVHKYASWTWRPVLQCDGFVVTCDGPWFATERECLDFIRTEILHAGIEGEQ